ncbi:Mitochondrial Rho GTPase [Carpediemonas membranifera]|uniref:Mitochondrial Rho GTPase n=1 Tax=Carpediemonas membranifera TaxID=201153 RepID=A0A8J6B128_9EUKA|nr:Mitochondrial Rho GTPase [Carpediemonas membranifera]|eukprot:KAG9390752.1 Mitochondrial Rho GTPase [Carpediemonas membranifera]
MHPGLAKDPVTAGLELSRARSIKGKTDMSRNRTTITVIGNPSVGKSSFVSKAVVREPQPEPTESVYPDVVVPLEDLGFDSSLAVNLVLVDTSSKGEHHAQLTSALRRADAIILVASPEEITAEKTVLEGRFPRLLSQYAPKAPVCLAVNKIDEVADREALSVALTKLVAEHTDGPLRVERGILVSAVTGEGVADAIFSAVNLARHPTATLLAHGHLTMEARRVLTRIFMYADRARTGILADEDLKEWQRIATGHAMTGTEIAQVKERIAVLDTPEGPPGVVPCVAPAHGTGVTLAGFLRVHESLVQRGAAGAVWDVLTAFGYGPDLEMRLDMADPVGLIQSARATLGKPVTREEAEQTITALGFDPQLAFEPTRDLLDWLRHLFQHHAEADHLSYRVLDESIFALLKSDPLAVANPRYRAEDADTAGLTQLDWLDLWKALAATAPARLVLALTELDFPALPGTVNPGRSPQELAHMARVALRAHWRHDAKAAAKRGVYRMAVIGDTRPSVPGLVRVDRMLFATVGLTHADLGARERRVAGPDNLFNFDGYVIVLSHAGGEALSGLAGTVHMAAQAGMPVVVAVATEETLSEPIQKVLATYRVSHAELVDLTDFLTKVVTAPAPSVDGRRTIHVDPVVAAGAAGVGLAALVGIWAVFRARRRRARL